MNTHDQIIRLAHRLSDGFPGNEYLVERLLLALLADGSVLLGSCSAPDAIRVFHGLARSVHADSCRIPFIHDESQSEAARFEVYRAANSVGEFLFQPALIFSNLILLEGVNHAPLQLQNALLSAIAEREVIVAGNSHPLPALFMVLATEDTSFDEESRTLSAEQCDRFLLHIDLRKTNLRKYEALPADETRPSPADLLKEIREQIPQRTLFDARSEARKVRMPDAVETYASTLADAIRRPADCSSELAHWLHRSANSARGSHAIERVARAHAWLHGHEQVNIDDVTAVAPDCLRHRVILNLRARAEGKSADDIISWLLDHPWSGATTLNEVHA